MVKLKSSSCLSLALILASGMYLPLQAQEITETQANPETNTEQTDTPEVTRPLNTSDSILSVTGGKSLIGEATAAVNEQRYDVAVQKLQEARKVFNQLSNFYLQLASSFSGINNDLSEAQRQKALETGQLRDEASYQLALVHRAQNKPELAVPLLIQVIRSQNPTSDLGKKCYQQLYEIGFVDTPYSTSNR